VIFGHVTLLKLADGVAVMCQYHMSAGRHSGNIAHLAQKLTWANQDTKGTKTVTAIEAAVLPLMG
jgi:hypothetical protein